jgi:hypothetical protein
MKRLLAALFLALVGALVGAIGVASADSNQDRVSGMGRSEDPFNDARLIVNATSGPSGEDPQGSFAYKQISNGTTLYDFSGRVTCVNVNGNLAGLAGVVTKSETPSTAPEGSTVFININDRGNVADDLGSIGLRNDPLTECGFESAFREFQKGNFIVQDATATTP